MDSPTALMDFSHGVSSVTNLKTQGIPKLAEFTASASESPVPSRLLNLYPHHNLTGTILKSVEPQLLRVLNTRDNSLGGLVGRVSGKLNKLRPSSPAEASLLREIQAELNETEADCELLDALRKAALQG